MISWAGTESWVADRFDDVVGHEGFAVVLADVAVGDEAGFAAEVARELAAVVVLDDDGAFGIVELIEDGFAVERNEPANLQLVGGNSLLC
jgi:hypothetical protein